jgi:hypothetical protein
MLCCSTVATGDCLLVNSIDQAACIRCIFGLLFLNAKTREVVFEKKKQDAWFDLICRTNSLFPFLSSQRKLEETS